MTEAAVTSSGMVLRLEGNVLSLFTAGMEQSQTFLEDPTRLEFEYMQHFDLSLKARHSIGVPLRVFHAGAGALSLPLAWAHARPVSRHVCADPDQDLLRLLKQWQIVDPKGRVRLRQAGALEALQGSNATYDVIVRDAFAGDSTPLELVTAAWVDLVKQRLTDGGTYLANVAHGGGHNGKQDVAAVVDGFRNVVAVVDRKVWANARLGNLAVIAWDEGEFDRESLESDLRRLALPVRLYSKREIKAWLGGALANPG